MPSESIGRSPGKRDGTRSISSTLRAGTPPQSMNVSLGEPANTDDVEVSTGAFTAAKSSSFEQTGIVYDWRQYEIGVSGLDNFAIGDNGELTVEQAPFQVMDADRFYEPSSGLFSWRRQENASNSFIQTALQLLDEQIVVFSYDYVPQSIELPGSGVVTLGARPADRCGDDWKYAPEAEIRPNYTRWSMNADEVSFGAYTFDSPGEVSFGFQGGVPEMENFGLEFPFAYRSAILKALGAQSETNAPCDVDVDIVLTIGKVELRVTAEDYVNHASEQSGTCALYLEFTNDAIIDLPTTVWNRYCFLLDYENAQLGFATRLQQ
ncbi:hypothetical protein M3Y99_01897600 [Aphelenchoides fujianensis]|nr:hypothetical protein M3Y99_01897600 [Aphelenchoides fujianensis]